MEGYSFHGEHNLAPPLWWPRTDKKTCSYSSIEIQSKKTITPVIGDEEEAQGVFFFLLFFLKSADCWKFVNLLL